MVAETNDPKFSFILLCAKICGDGHYNMKRTVAVVSQEEYDAWIKRQPTYLNDELRTIFNLPGAPAPSPATATPAADTTATKTVTAL